MATVNPFSRKCLNSFPQGSWPVHHPQSRGFWVLVHLMFWNKSQGSTGGQGGFQVTRRIVDK